MPEIAPSLSIGQVAERTGLSVHALRFYERQGLLANAVRRRPNGQRVYSEDDVEWLTTCTMLRASGMPLTTIRRYVDLVRQGAGNEEDRLAVLRHHHEQLTRQIGELTKCLDLIRYKVRVYEDRLAQGTAHHRTHTSSPSEHQQQNDQANSASSSPPWTRPQPSPGPSRPLAANRAAGGPVGHQVRGGQVGLGGGLAAAKVALERPRQRRVLRSP